MKPLHRVFPALLVATLSMTVPRLGLGLSNVFTYQGQLQQSGIPVNGTCDFRFTLFDAASAGTQIGGSVVRASVTLADGLFTVPLDFGSAPFAEGQDRWMEIEVRCPSNQGAYTALAPLQQITATPYALFTPAAGSVPWAGLEGVPGGFSDGVDDDTTYTPGSGLMLLGNQFSIDTNAVQARIVGSCAAGSSMRSIDANGGVVCETDNDSGGTITSVLAGTGLAGGGASGGVSLAINFAGSGAASTAARSDHHHDDVYEQRLGRTVIVSPVGTSTENGTALVFALANLTGASSCSEPYLVKIEPGIYDLGTQLLIMLECVDIEGSGENVTLIRGEGRAFPNTGTVVGASNAELRLATIENVGGNDAAVALYVGGATSMKLTHLTVRASGATNNYAIVTKDSAVDLSLVTAEASGGSDARAIYVTSSDPFQPAPTLTNVRATASAASPFVAAVYNEGSSTVMTNVNAAANGTPTGVAFGVYNSGPSLPVLSGGGILVQGADTGIGVYNTAGAGTRMGDTTVSVFLNGSSHGVENSESSVTLSGVRVSAFLSLASFGLINIASGGSFFVDVDDSQIAADDNTVSSDTGFSTRIGASKLQGGPVAANGGTVVCAGVYDENYVFAAGPNCP